ncbi:hypothetical protein Tco_0816925 [Tanacetum coccineum]
MDTAYRYFLSKTLNPIRHMALPPRDQRHQYLRFEGLEYTDADIVDFEIRLGKIYSKEVHRVLVLDFKSLPTEMAEGLSGRMLMEHRDAQGQSVFTSHAWRRLFEVRGPLVFELIMEFFSTFRFSEVSLDIDAADTLQFQLGRAKRRMSWRQLIFSLGLHTTEEMQTAGFGLYWTESARQISDKGDLSAYWRGISSKGDFLGTPPSYTLIRDPMLRLCYRLIACSITGRSQAPKKICEELVNTWSWVAPRLERQPDVAAGAPVDAGGAPDINEGAQAVPVPAQAPQPPLAAGPARTMA